MTTHQAVFVLIGLAAILTATRLVGMLARRLGQPAVIGEMAAGILLGPSLFHGAIASAVFPADTRPMLAALANVGVAVFMFIVGAEIDHRLLRRGAATALTVSIGSVILPFVLGVGLAFLLVEPGMNRTGFALFMGTAMSITAFPVLARILHDRKIRQTRVGGLALMCASVDDVVAWTILAAVVAMVGGQAGQWRLLLFVPYLLITAFAIRPLLRKFHATTNSLVLVVAGLALSGAATEWMGLHFIFGAFLFGMVMPRNDLTTMVHDRVEPFGTNLLLPIFFAVAGLSVDLSGLGAAGLGQLALILVVAVGGKFGGAYIGARIRKEKAYDSAVLAVLMNTRGLTELIVLTIGLQLGILDTRVYSMLVVMALVTTAMAGPVLNLLERRNKRKLVEESAMPSP